MICTKCGAQMRQTDKNTMSGRVIREYDCRECGHFDWADEGVALWRLMHDARTQDEIEAARGDARNAKSGLDDTLPARQNRRTSLWQRLARFCRGKK